MTPSGDSVYPLVPRLLEFRGWPKITRLAKSLMVITEKIDGTNAAVGIMSLTAEMKGHPDLGSPAVKLVELEDSGGLPHNFMVYAQSRKRIISPFDDNFGFARWTHENAETLVSDLGSGLHFGEWWGQGIQRGYGVSEKFFSLFNTLRWQFSEVSHFKTPGMYAVPELRRHSFDTDMIHDEFEALRRDGSVAAAGWDKPEGIVIHVPDVNGNWKMTFDGDEPKSVVLKEAALWQRQLSSGRSRLSNHRLR